MEAKKPTFVIKCSVIVPLIMATFHTSIGNRRTDGKYLVSIRVTWKRQKAYISTGLYLTDRQIDKAGQIKDKYTINECEARKAEYESIKAKLGYKIELYTAKELAEYLHKEATPGTDGSINFVEFSEGHINKLKEKGRVKNAECLKRSLNSIIDFTGRRIIYISEINAKFLIDFEEYLRGEHTVTLNNRFNKPVKVKHQGLSDVSVIGYLVDLRTLFNAARKEYNDEDRGEVRIRHYPFKKGIIKPVPEPEKRVLTLDEVRKVFNVQDVELELSRAIMARDVFILSFCLAGMNLADLWELGMDNYNNGRIEYKRLKTMDRRRDRAFISLKAFDPVPGLLEKYRGKEKLLKFPEHYSTTTQFVKMVNKGLETVAEKTGITELTTYYARFSFASIARNDLKISPYDINVALNHVDKSLKMADVYIKKDWSLVDDTVRKVVNLVSSSESESNSVS